MASLKQQFGEIFIIPEGGANAEGRQGAEDIANYIPGTYTHICVSVGSGTTFIGLRNALSQEIKLLGFAPMKGGVYLAEEIRQFLQIEKDHKWTIFDRWHFGGFGKANEELLAFMNDFYRNARIPLDIVYTGKMMYGVKDLLAENYFPSGSKILCIHTGGLQGNRSVKQRLIY